MRKYKSPKQEHICKVLRGYMLKNLLLPGKKLPSVRKLAKEFYVSHLTILGAIAKLEKQGLVTRVMGKGVFVGKMEETGNLQPCIQQRESKADMIANQIISDITTGNLRSGDFLPLQKSLRYDYGASQSTIKAAVQKIFRKGLIHRKGSWYMVGAIQAHGPWKSKSQCKVYFFSEINIHGSGILLRLRYFIRILEEELARHGVCIHFVNYSQEHNLMFVPNQDPDVLGFVYMEGSIHFSKPPYGLDIERIKNDLQYLGNFKKPVVWCNFNRVINVSESFSKLPGKYIYPFYIDFMGAEAGEALGAYLGSLGHKNVAFISSLKESWCEQRLAGLKRGLTNVHGNNARVINFSTEFKKNLCFIH